MYARTRDGVHDTPSITTIMDEHNERMEWWDALCAAECAIEHAELLVSVKNLPGREKWPRLRKAKDFMKDAAMRDRNRRAFEGDLVHNYAEQVALHQLGQATQADIAAARQAAISEGAEALCVSFDQFWQDYSPRVLVPEATVWGMVAGRSYAGTTDLICEITIHGRPTTVCLDYKGKRALYKRNGDLRRVNLSPKTAVQLAAAAFADERWVPGEAEDGSQDRWVPFEHTIEVALGVALAPDGYLVRQYDIHNPMVWEAFAAMRTLFDFSQSKADLMGPVMSGTPETIRTRQVA